ncbi:MAG: glutamate formimidoyltransferase [Vicinamibacterales bacterium]
MIESVPNVSEGRRPEVVELIVKAIRQTPGVRVLDWSSDFSHNRSVFSFVGEAGALADAVLAIYTAAVSAIDMREHQGAHPRIGAVDVVPFIPLAGSTMDECVALARRVGALVAARFSIPVYLYEEAASRPDRRNLADVRRGGFEGLASRMATDDWRSDFGPASPHPSAGASAIGARSILVAFNVNLATDRLADARAIAAAIRERSGGLPGLKAIGVPLDDRGIVQVSMNLTDYRRTTMADAFEAVVREANARGVKVLESELIGLAPAAAFGGASPAELLLVGPAENRTLEARLDSTI